jgi:hypothetical protein
MSTKDKVLSVAIRMCDTMYDEKVKRIQITLRKNTSRDEKRVS